MTTITIPRETFDQMREALELVYSKLSGNVNGADEHCFTISMKNQISYIQMCRISEALSAAKVVQPQAQGEVDPVAWMHITDDGHIRMWSKSSPESIEAAIGVKPIPLYRWPAR